MGSKDGGPLWKAGLRFGTGATGSSSCSSSAAWPGAREDKKMPAARPRKPKRTSFACLECSKTFPTQQAMAGHCSAHTRAGARTRRPDGYTYTNHLSAAAPVAVAGSAPSIPLSLPLPPQHHANAVQYWCPPVQVAPSTIPMPPMAIRYVPYARPASNQMMARLPYLDPHGRRSSRTLPTIGPRTNPAFRPRPAAGLMPNVMPSGRLGWRAFVPVYGVPPPFGVNGAPLSGTDLPGRTRAADLTLRLGSGRGHAQKRAPPLLESLMASDGHQQEGAGRKCKLVTTDGGDHQGRNRGKCLNQMAGLDLELRLYR